MVNTLIAVGEKTGSLDEMWEQGMEFYDPAFVPMRYAIGTMAE